MKKLKMRNMKYSEGVKIIFIALLIIAIFQVEKENTKNAFAIFDQESATTTVATTSVPIPTLMQEDDIDEEAEGIGEKSSLFIDEATIKKGYTVKSFDDKLQLSLVPGVFNGTTSIETEIVEEKSSLPWKLERITPVYQFDFADSTSYNNHHPFYIQVAYNEESKYYKQVFFYDKGQQKWRALPTTDFPDKKFVRSLIHLPYARLAVFENKEIMTYGEASWYAYKGGDFAASPDFPKGSKVRVFNLWNDKFVDVTINDYGPDRSIFPNRVIDLDKVAFGKISPLGAGIIDTKIEPIYIASEGEYEISGLSDDVAQIEPEVSAKSAIIVNKRTGEVVWGKNTKQALPLASLTKIVAMKVFLDQDIDMEKVVAYTKQDELYNNAYCNPWESARVRLFEGETVTVNDLFNSALVGSANNAVESLVRVSGLSRDDFVKEMNEYVANLGAKSTHFIEPTGLAPENITTVKEYAIISKDVLENDLIGKTSVLKKYEFTTLNTKDEHTIKNTNPLIKYPNNLNSFNSIKIAGAKTGYLHEAGHCLMIDVDYGHSDFIAIVLNSKSGVDRIADIKNLIQYGIIKL